MELVYLFTGLAIGFVLAWFIKKTKNDDAGSWKNSYDIKSADLDKTKAEMEISRGEIIHLNKELAAQASNNENLKIRLAEQKQEIEQLNQQLKTEFENLANKILEEKSRKFTEQNRTNLDEILKPFNEKIKDFEKKVAESYDKEMRDKISLREEVKKLYELNSKISEEANNLTKALKGDTKKQGNWGELILEKVLERSGLTKDVEYRNQVVTRNVNGELIKPDVVVFLPDNKHLIIDSKVSLLAYEQYMNAEDLATEQKERALKEHLNSVRNHVKLLSEKNYFTSPDFTSPDFVLLFMPVESAFSLAVQYDNELFNFAWDKRIVIVSPTTLLATLKTVSSLWKIENQNRYAIEIADRAGALYDKFVGFVQDLLDVGKRMDDSKKSYEEAMKKIASGTGNLINRVETLKKLGAKATKNLPKNLLDRSGEE